MRTLVLVVLCITVFLFLIAVGLDATDCSMNHTREMLKHVCSHYRRKRGFAYNGNLRKPKHHHRYKNSMIDQQDNFEIVANDTSGGILIRHKRNSLLMYCCTTLKNCTHHFRC